MKQELIVKSNTLLQHPLYKKTTELKIFSRIILAIRDDPKSNIFEFKVKELLEKFQGGIDNYAELKQIAKGMFKVVDLNPSEKTFHLSAIFTDISTHEEGIITFEVNPKIKPFLLDLTTNFTQYYFENIARLKSSFSIRIYELLKQYEKIGDRTIELEHLRYFLSIEETQYARFNDFKRFVLLVAYKELKEKTDICFEFEEIKKGRKISKIKFIIFKNNKNSSKPTQEQTQLEKLNHFSEVQTNLINKLVDTYKVSKKIAEDLVLSVSIKQIEDNIIYAENEYKKGAITKNFTGYLLNAIKNNYAGNISLFELNKHEQKEQERKKAQVEAKKEALKAQLTKEFGIQARQKFIDSLTEEQHQTLIQTILKEVEHESYTVSQVKKKGLNTPTIYILINQKIEGFAEQREAFIAEGLKKAGFN